MDELDCQCNCQTTNCRVVCSLGKDEDCQCLFSVPRSSLYTLTCRFYHSSMQIFYLKLANRILEGLHFLQQNSRELCLGVFWYVTQLLKFLAERCLATC